MQKFKANGNEIKRLRLQDLHCSKQTDFADKVGIGIRTFRKIENNDHPITLAEAERIAAVLGVKWKTLVYGANGPQLVSAQPSPSAPEPEFDDYPRFDFAYAHAVANELALYNLAISSETIISKSRIELNDELAGYASRVLEIAEILAHHRRQWTREVPEEIALKRELRQLIVLLKGNDVWIYVHDHMKYLPESYTIVDSKTRQIENQLIMIFDKPGEYGEDSVKVDVDNGQPIRLPRKIVFPAAHI